MTRFRAALSGGVLTPPVRGISFVDPCLLPRYRDAAGDEAAALSRACVELRLDFAFVPSWEPWAADALAGLHAAGIAALWVVPGVVTPALEALGVERGLRDSIRDPERVTGAMDAAVPAALAAAARGRGLGADAVVVADDLAGGGGPLLAVAFLREQAFPRLARVAAAAIGAGVPALLHCDGDARSLMPAASAAGFAGLHGDLAGAAGIEPALAVARAAGLVLLGGIPTSALTGSATGARAGALAAKRAAGGGLLVCDDGGVAECAQVEALYAALGAAR